MVLVREALLATALRYARAGHPVLPIAQGGKVPLAELVPHGLKDATTDEATIRAWWEQHPDANVGMRSDGLVVIDVDPGGDLAALTAEFGELPQTRSQSTPRGGRHLLFRLPAGVKFGNSTRGIGSPVGIDVRAGERGYIVVAPSSNGSGAYRWQNALPIADAPSWLVAALTRPEAAPSLSMTAQPRSGETTRYGRAALDAEANNVRAAVEGGRNSRLNEAAFALGQLEAGGELAEGDAEQALKQAALACGLPQTEAARTVRSGLEAGRSSPRSAPEKPQAIVAPPPHLPPAVAAHAGESDAEGHAGAGTIDDARAAFQRWLYLPDTGALDIVLATVAANRLDGDPVWTLIVGPPGGGKSEILTAISGLPDAYPAATLTEAALLSGTPKREKANEAKGGLLRTIGDHGIIVCKDFGSVLSMNRDARSLLLAALREVYDGAWTRHIGTDGGRTLSWAGKVGLVGGCTPTIDRHHAVMGAMGERFVLYRLPDVNPDTQARQALGHAGREKQMRAELAAAVHAVLRQASTTPRERTEDETNRLVSLATLVVRARSAVERDGFSREIELVSSPEAPTRLIIVLDRLLAGLDAIGVTRDHAWRVVSKAALDSVPALRLRLLYALEGGTLDTNQLATAIRHPSSTTRRALEDLTAHGLVECKRQDGQNRPHLWSLSSFTRERLVCVPEMSPPTQSERYRAIPATLSRADISGMPPTAEGVTPAHEREAGFAASHVEPPSQGQDVVREADDDDDDRFADLDLREIAKAVRPS